LERGRRVHETKEHDERFKHATVGFEGSFPLVARTDANVVIPPSDVELCEDTSIFEFVDDVGDERERVLVLDRERVQLTVVLHRTEFTILLFDEEEGRSEGGNRRSNITSSGHIIKESIEGGLFHRTKGINLAVILGDSFRFEIDGMIPFAEWRKFM